MIIAHQVMLELELMTDNIDTNSIELIDDVATGVALIFVNQQGENVIGIHAGAKNISTTTPSGNRLISTFTTKYHLKLVT